MNDPQAQTGLQQLLAIRDGVAPPAPIQEVLGFDLLDVSEGTARFQYVGPAAGQSAGPI